MRRVRVVIDMSDDDDAFEAWDRWAREVRYKAIPTLGSRLGLRARLILRWRRWIRGGVAGRKVVSDGPYR